MLSTIYHIFLYILSYPHRWRYMLQYLMSLQFQLTNLISLEFCLKQSAVGVYVVQKHAVRLLHCFIALSFSCRSILSPSLEMHGWLLIFFRKWPVYNDIIVMSLRIKIIHWKFCKSCSKQAGWFLRPDCTPSSECPRASIAARSHAASSIRISRRPSCCCSSAIARIAIGANSKIYLLRQFCWNGVEFFYNTQETTDAKNDGPELWNSNSVILIIFLNFQKASRGPFAADLDHYGRGQTRSQ